MEDLFKLIPDKYADVIGSRLAMSKIGELRVRNSAPVRIEYDGGYRYLCATGITDDPSGAFIAQKNEAENIVMRACNRSFYTVTDTLRCGYVSVSGGIRIGVCGNAVVNDGRIAAVKNISSVNIRLPHEVKGVASTLYLKISGKHGIYNTLIISPPGAGKTTLLRDLCRRLSDSGLNVLLCDEKYELAAARDGVPTLDVGKNTDVISGADKQFVFETGIAYMRPDVIMTDELFEKDCSALLRAVHSGISVISTVHARDMADYEKKPEFKRVNDCCVFERFAVISVPGRYLTVYEKGGAII